MTNTIFCTSCGTAFGSTSKFCGKCGKPAPAQAPTSAPPPVVAPMPSSRPAPAGYGAAPQPAWPPAAAPSAATFRPAPPVSMSPPMASASMAPAIVPMPAPVRASVQAPASGPMMAGGRPLGQIRSAGTVMLLAIVTIGIYGVIWYYQNYEELKRYSGQGIGGGFGLVLSFIFPPANAFILPGEVGKLYLAEGATPPVTGATGWWLFLPLVGGLIWLFKTQDALNGFWRAKGVR